MFARWTAFCGFGSSSNFFLYDIAPEPDLVQAFFYNLRLWSPVKLVLETAGFCGII